MRITTLLSTALLVVGGVAAQDARGGTHSDVFDKAKYQVPDRLLMTPQSHANLFTFTGRWLRSPTAHPHEPAYHATLWPGNSFTALFYGDSAALRLLTQPQGKVDAYSYMVSIDGGPEVQHNIPALETTSKNGHTIPIFPPRGQPTKRDPRGPMTPHTIRVTSVPDTPLSFEGLLVENAQIAQGRLWHESQSLRPTIEFIGEGIDAERLGGFFLEGVAGVGENTATPREALLSTTHYRAAETLGVRHYHITANTCLLDNCNTAVHYTTEEGKPASLPGLQEQYFYTSPLNATAPQIVDKFDPRNIESLTAPWRFPATSTDPAVPHTHVGYVVVDTGVLDLLIHGQTSAAYTHALTLFLARIRNQSHPAAKILVVARRGIPDPLDTVIPRNPDTLAARDALYTATAAAVAAVADTNTVFTPISISSAETAHDAYLRAICPFLLPPPGILAKTKAIFRKSGGLTKAERVCLAIDDSRYEAGAKGVVTWLFFVGLCVGGLWIARSTITGAVAAVLGRQRLGMEEEGLLEREVVGVKQG